MMGRITIKDSFFYSFRLEDAVPDDHLVRAIAGVLDLSWVHIQSLGDLHPIRCL
jgi:hypothetical protein